MKSRTLVLTIGGILGALLGMLVAWILMGEGEQGTEVGPGGAVQKKIRPSDAINLALATMGVARQVAALRQR